MVGGQDETVAGDKAEEGRASNALQKVTVEVMTVKPHLRGVVKCIDNTVKMLTIVLMSESARGGHLKQSHPKRMTRTASLCPSAH